MNIKDLVLVDGYHGAVFSVDHVSEKHGKFKAHAVGSDKMLVFPINEAVDILSDGKVCSCGRTDCL